MNVERIRYNLDSVRCRIAEAAVRAGTSRGDVSVWSPSPRKALPNGSGPWSRVAPATSVKTTPRNYGAKSTSSPTSRTPFNWHLIGHLQTNKVKKTLPMVTMIHSVDSLKLLRALDEAAPASLSDPPGVCLQVNTSDEPSKHGWSVRRDRERSRVDRRVSGDTGGRLDDDGRAGNHCRDRARVVRAAPSSFAIN